MARVCVTEIRRNKASTKMWDFCKYFMKCGSVAHFSICVGRLIQNQVGMLLRLETTAERSNSKGLISQ